MLSRLPKARTVLLLLCGVAVLSFSAAISLRNGPFHEPPAAATEATTEVVQEETLAPGASHPPQALGAPTSSDSPSTETSPSLESVIVIHDPATMSQSPRVVHLPDRALIEESESGPLPVRATDGRRPFDAYSRAWSGASGPRIAIVIGGLGISQTGTMEAIEKLPPEITLAFAPLGNSLYRWMQTARRQGHEVMLQVPMEPFGFPATNPGRRTLLTKAEPARNLENLRWILSRITNYTGVMNYMGSRFTADDAALGLLMDELSQRGLGYLDDGTSVASLAEKIALSKKVPFAASDAVIDAQREQGAILAKLNELERIARLRGYAVGSGSALEVTVETVAGWSEEVRSRGIELVPVSAVVRDPERERG